MKKLLALVLALVMTLGLATVSSSAAYSDEADVSLNEAVDVMSAVGVFQGADGKFSPKANLNREQAAKLIAYLDLGESAAEALPAVKVFDDVPATSWSAKYIAYCADAGYIVGDGTGKFNPAGELNGYAFGKMLLCVLGYDADIEGFTGNTWSINVAKLMEKLDLADGIDSAASLTLTREQAAQYCLNALKSDVVDYATKGTNVTINGAVIATGASKAESVTSTSTGNADNNDAISAANDGNGKDYVQLGERLYKGDLEIKTAGTNGYDGMHRPAHTWFYKDKEVSKVADAADQTFVISKLSGTKDTLGLWLKSINDDYTTVSGTAQTAAALETALTNTFVYVNGTGTAAANYDKTDGTTWGLGDVVEVYENSNDSDKIDRVVITQNTLYQISKVDTDVNTADKKDDVTAYITLKTLGGAETIVKDTDIVGYDAATYVKDAYVAAVLNGTDVLSSYVVGAPAEGKYTAVSGSKYTVAGSTYEKALNAVIPALDYDSTYAAYTDANGYLLGIKLVEAAQISSDAVFVLARWIKNGSDNYNVSTDKYYAQLVDMSGALSEIVTGYTTAAGKIVGRDADGYTYTEVTSGAKGDTVYFVKNADGTITSANLAAAQTTAAGIAADTNVTTERGAHFYTRSAAAQDVAAGHVFTTEDSGDDYTKLIAYADTSSVKVGSLASVKDKGSSVAKFTGVSIDSGTKTVYFTDNTQFIIVEGTLSDAEVTVKAGTKATFSVASSDATIIANKSNNNYEAAYVVLPTASYTGSTSADVIYVNSKTTTTVDGGKTFSAFDMKGEQITVKVASDATVSENTFYTIASTNSKGVSTLTDPVDTLTKDVNWDENVLQLVNVKFVNLYNDKFTLTNGTYSVNDIDGANVVVIDKHEADQDEFEVGTSYDGTKNYKDANNYQNTYSGSVTSLSAMNSAVDSGYGVTFSTSIDEDGAQIIVIKEVSKTVGTPGADA